MQGTVNYSNPQLWHASVTDCINVLRRYAQTQAGRQTHTHKHTMFTTGMYMRSLSLSLSPYPFRRNRSDVVYRRIQCLRSCRLNQQVTQSRYFRQSFPTCLEPFTENKNHNL